MNCHFFIPLFAAALLLTTDVRANDQVVLDEFMKAGAGIDRLNALIIAQDGKILAERAFRGPRLTTPVNVKSVSKSLLSAIAGLAVDKGLLTGTEMKIAPVFDDWLPKDAEPRKHLINLDHLLSMRAGLERTSGKNYGRWVKSKN
jgi:CubicO group peptidase (beta-lactamase class C family)